MRILRPILFVLAIAPWTVLALVGENPITKQTQAQYEVEFTLKAVHTFAPNRVVVTLEAPLQGKLKTLALVRVVLQEKDEYGEGERIDYSMQMDLATKTKDGRLTAWFSLSPELAQKCHLLLWTEMSDSYAHIFNVRLREYIEEEKVTIPNGVNR